MSEFFLRIYLRYPTSCTLAAVGAAILLVGWMETPR